MPERQTKATQERHERMLLELLKEPGNDRCADCQAKNPRWASYSLGVFLCIRCAGLHRKMGTHISRVKSVTMDQWTLEQIDMIRKSGGNDKVNSIVNPHPDRHPLPIGDDDDDRAMEKYVRQKWEKREFMDTPAMPPRPSTLQPNAQMKTLPKRSSSVPVLVRSEGDYSAALARLAEMGFKDTEMNSQILRQTQGNLQATIEVLSRLSSAQTPLASSAFHLSDEQKLLRLQELGFSDPNANRDALRRSGGNLEVAVDILQAARKTAAEASKPSAFTDTTNTTSQELAGRAQTSAERQAHKLSGGRTGTLVDVDVSSQTTPAAATTNISNPFHGSFQQPQQQPFVQSGNPFSQIYNPMSMNTSLTTSSSATLHPQLTGYVQQNSSNQPFLGLQPQMTGLAPPSPNMNAIQPTPTGSSNPFSQMTGSTSSMTSTTSNIFQNQFAPPQRSYTAPSFPVASSPFSSMSSGPSLQVPQQQQQQQQPGFMGNQSMPNFNSAIPSQPTGFQGSNIFATSPSIANSNSNNPWASQNTGGGSSFF